MGITNIRHAIICIALATTSFAAVAGEREIFFNGVEVSDHNIQVIEKSYGIEFENGRYWYDRESGLFGSDGSGPEGRIAAGLHIGGPTPEALSTNSTDLAPEIEADGIDEESGMTAEDVGELVGGVLGLMMLGEMMEAMNEPEPAYYGGDQYYGDVYYEGGAYPAGPDSYYDQSGNYEYNSSFGGGSQYSDGSWIHSTNDVGSVGGTSDGCIYTSVGGGWSNC